MVVAVVTPRSPIIDAKSGLLTREGFRFLDQLNKAVTDIASVLIEDAINNGVTDKAPSENAVFDALALKANANEYLSLLAAAAGYQPLDSQLTSLAALADAAGVLTNDGAGVLSWTAASGATITLGTPTTTTSLASWDYSGFPATTKLIGISLVGFSTSGTSVPIIQIGDSGGIETSGYLGGAGTVGAGAVNAANFTTGFGLAHAWSAGAVAQGAVLLSLENSSSATWAASGGVARSDTAGVHPMGGTKSLSAGPLTSLRLTTVGGADTGDAGEFNIWYMS